MAFRKYPPANQIASPTELRELYNDAVGEINNYKKWPVRPIIPHAH